MYFSGDFTVSKERLDRVYQAEPKYSLLINNCWTSSLNALLLGDFAEKKTLMWFKKKFGFSLIPNAAFTTLQNLFPDNYVNKNGVYPMLYSHFGKNVIHSAY